jgi:hypothetical protein
MRNEKLYTLIKSPIVTEKSARIGANTSGTFFFFFFFFFFPRCPI